MKIREIKPAITIKRQAEKIRFLEHQNELLRKQLFGESSERKVEDDGSQTNLFAEQVAALTEDGISSDPIPAETETDSKGKKTRKPLPSKLKRIDTVIDLSEEEKLCPICNEPMDLIGEDRTEKLEYIRALLLVSAFIRPKYACKKHPEAGVAQAELPPQLIEKGIPAASLVAYIIYAKYFLHLPLHRLEKMFSHYGCDIKRQRMCDWEQHVASLLVPVLEAMRRQVDSSGSIQMDETPFKVMKDQSDGKLATGYFWARSDGKQVIFEYDPSRAGKNAVEFLKDFSGFLQTDGYSCYDTVSLREDIIHLACWAHARRKFVEAESQDKKFCSVIVAKIRELYAIERAAKIEWDRIDKEFPHESEEILEQKKYAARFMMRLKGKAGQKVTDLFALLEANQFNYTPQDPVRKAIAYVIKRKELFITYLYDGRLEIDNNGIENRIRPITLGRKNWLFAGSQSGAKKIATMASLTGSAAMLGIDPYEYLHWLLTELPETTDYESLTPLSYKRSQTQSA
jgi:transposase